MDYKLLKEQPPIYQQLHDQFGVEWGHIIIAYHPNIYCAKDISEQKLVHECIHLVRQEDLGVETWWNLYLTNPSFRLEEELLAYSEEISYIEKQNYDRNYRKFLCNIIYNDLSSSIYGFMITKGEAKRLLT